MARVRKKATSSSLSSYSTSAMPTPYEVSLPLNGASTTDDDNGKGIKRNRLHTSRQRLQPTNILHHLSHVLQLLQRTIAITTSTYFSLAAIALVAAGLVLDIDEDLQPKMLKVGMGYLFILHPLLSTLSVSCGVQTLTSRTSTSEQGGAADPTTKKKKNWQEQIIAFSFLISIICNQLPKWLSAFVASFAVFAFGLASRQLVPQHTQMQQQSLQKQKSKSDGEDVSNSGDTAEFINNSSNTNSGNRFQQTWSSLTIKERATIGTLAVVTSLLLENFLIWVVSATYKPGIIGSPDALQDNGRIVLESLAVRLMGVEKPYMARRGLQSLRDALNVQWALVSALGASFVCLELQLGNNYAFHRTLAGLALHALMTLASARLIRTISFVLTVLPSQVPNCYRRHFPMPPATWKEWLMVGFLPNSRGGCNDLILSGHATVTSTLGCASTSVASNTRFSMALWTLMALDYSIEAYQGLHYSVDMWLGCIVTCLLWQLTKPLELEGELEERTRSRVKGATVAKAPPLDAKVVAMYAAPAFLGFVILTTIPEAIVNYFLVGYTLWAGGIFAQWGFTNFSQHILLCLLFVTLGTYL